VAHERLYRLGERVRAQGEPRLLEAWRRLGTSDHCYYMCTKWFADGDVHKYFNPHESPYDAFAFMNALTDLERRCEGRPIRVEVPAAKMGVIV
jgi:alpha-amylase